MIGVGIGVGILVAAPIVYAIGYAIIAAVGIGLDAWSNWRSDARLRRMRKKWDKDRQSASSNATRK
jgi:ABC-type Fe3+ transport system permease subunit